AEVTAIQGANDAHGDSLAHAKRISDRQGVVAHLQFGGITNCDCRESASFHLQHGNVSLRIASHNGGLQLALVGQRYADVGGAVDDMVIRHDVPVRTDDDAGTKAVLALIMVPGRTIFRIGAELWSIVPELLPKELLEKWRHSVRKITLDIRAIGTFDDLGRGNIHD